MTDLIDTTEMYLRTILELEEDGVVPMRARIAERLGHSGPTVSQTIARMERDGLVGLADDRHLLLTDHGRLLATRVMRKHRLAERLLVDVLGLELEYVHDEACRWEHVISERVERKIVALLAEHELSPYGNPIPGLGELGVAVPRQLARGVGGGDARPLTAFAEATPTLVRLARIGEWAQVDVPVREELQLAGALPGAQVEVWGDEGAVRIRPVGGSREVVVPLSVASHVFAVATT